MLGGGTSLTRSTELPPLPLRERVGVRGRTPELKDTMQDKRDHNRRHSNRRGQTLIIAIMIMFILAVVAAVFIALIARNLFRSERFSNVDAVAQLAEAGVRYADKMLVSSEEGADWRPVPDNDGVVLNPDGSIKLDTDGKPIPVLDYLTQRDRYPDFKWSRAYWPTELGCAGPTGGYTTFNTGEGRFLLRVSYNPNPKDPYSKYIKIESIGRWGIFDENDPTTWRPNGDVLLRREVTAFKPIGVTDYLRFVTNRNNRSAEFALGCPGFNFTFGRLDPGGNYAGWYRGGPIRVNGNALFYGNQVNLFLRGTHPVKADMTVDDTIWSPLDMVEVSGDIRFARLPDDSPLPMSLQRMDPDGNLLDSTPISLYESGDAGFSTVGGFVRDGSDMTDNANMARGVKRIEPPLIDQMDPTNSVTRYQVLSRYSGPSNLARYGWGRGVYIDNSKDKQDESETLIGGVTLRGDWTKPNNLMTTYWKGPYYVPPAAIITLNPVDTDNDGVPDFKISRTDTGSAGRSYVWRDAWGNLRPEWGGTVTMPYPDPKNGRRIYRYASDGTVDLNTYKTLDGNGVIYAEGNIRIRGMLPPGMQLTVVSNENIYIDGSLLKNRPPGWNDSGSALDPFRGADQTCGLALLARQNICVNTTQFFSPLNSISPENQGPDAQDGEPPYHLRITSSPESQFKAAFEMGPWESETGAPAASTNWMLFLRHSGEYGPTYINAWLNPNSSLLNFGMMDLNQKPSPQPLPRHVWGIGDPQYSPAGWGVDSMFVGDVFQLTDSNLNANLGGFPGDRNLIQIALDQTSYSRHNYQMGGVAIQPMDIRIEAILYAQEGSFFVIPGTWFNPDTNDTPGATVRPGVDPLFPHYGQALDIRVVIDGAVSENTPAEVGDVEDWMSKWGRIPLTYGSTTTPTAHPGEGLTILYDDHCGWPLSDLRSAQPSTPIRTDKFGRALPIAPKLPVSSSLIYFGDVM